MDTDLDPDDAIGRRFGELHTWKPSAPTDDAWRGVEHLRHRRRNRRYVAAAAAVVLVAVGTVAIVASTNSSNRRVTVIAPTDPPVPPIVHVLTPAPVGNITVSPAGPYRAGQTVRAQIGRSDAFQLEDPYNSSVAVCFPYARGETCDPSVQSRPVTIGRPNVVTFDLELPGWVHTPTGLQPCAELGCRLEITNDGEHWVGTAPLEIDPGPKPEELARIEGIHRDESLISLHIDSLRPDPSWVAAKLPPSAGLPPGGLSLCAFAERLLCDALVRPDPPPFDGQPHDLTIDTNRLLLTTRGWVDCVNYVCAIAISRTINVMSLDNGGTQAGDKIIAIVPYRLPPTTPEMPRPSLTLDRTGPFVPDDEVTVTLHDPPPNVGPEHLQLGQCTEEDLRPVMDCRLRFGSWTRLPDGALRQQWRIAAPCEAPGCYLAIAPPSKGHPDVARTQWFTLTS